MNRERSGRESLTPNTPGIWCGGSAEVAGATFFLAVLGMLTFGVPRLSSVYDDIGDYANTSWAALALPGVAARAAMLVFIGWELATGWRVQGADSSQRRGGEAAHGH